jgi:hypothetical protein
VLRWEILEVIERDGVLIKTQLYRPLGASEPSPDTDRLPFHPDNDISQLISAALFDGFEPVSHSVVGLPDGSLQQHWVFRLQVEA